jgi:hypothetical protein
VFRHEKMRKSKRLEYSTKIILTFVFLGLFVLFVSWMASTGQGLSSFHMNVLDLVLLVFATLRMGRMISYDLVMEPLRSIVARTVKDETGAGDSVEPKGTGIQYSLGQLIACPICVGTWVAAIFLYGFYVWPGPTRVLVTIMAIIGFAELVNALVEYYCWVGQEGRVRAGALLKAERARLDSEEASEPERIVQTEVEDAQWAKAKDRLGENR